MGTLGVAFGNHGQEKLPGEAMQNLTERGLKVCGPDT